MNFLSLLASESFSVLNQGFTVNETWFTWLTDLIRILIEGVGMIGVGIILFTLILKAVVLPFDVYQRYTQRKQTMIMRNMKPELDKLQKQYANDKQTYSLKINQLYKKNGYSMFSACLPMIISFVVLIIAFQAFNEFSQQANLALYERMSTAYNGAVTEYCLTPEEYAENPALANVSTRTVGEGEAQIVYTVVEGKDAKDFLYFEVDENATNKVYQYYVDTVKMQEWFAADEQLVNGQNVFENYYQSEYDKKSTEQEKEGYTKDYACAEYLAREIGAVAAAEAYHDNPPSFLWIQNIWFPDVAWSHPIQNYSGFTGSITSQIKLPDGGVDENGNPTYQEKRITTKELFTEAEYNNLTYKLSAEKSACNGYFVLVVLSIGLMFLSQLIMTKSTKETNQYQSVDGKGNMAQKMTLILMPLMYAIFAFINSSAFSIYMVMSSAITIVTTLLINVILNVVFRRKEVKKIKAQYGRELPWQKDGAKRKEVKVVKEHKQDKKEKSAQEMLSEKGNTLQNKNKKK